MKDLRFIRTIWIMLRTMIGPKKAIFSFRKPKRGKPSLKVETRVGWWIRKEEIIFKPMMSNLGGSTKKFSSCSNLVRQIKRMNWRVSKSCFAWIRNSWIKTRSIISKWCRKLYTFSWHRLWSSSSANYRTLSISFRPMSGSRKVSHNSYIGFCGRVYYASQYTITIKRIRGFWFRSLSF